MLITILHIDQATNCTQDDFDINDMPGDMPAGTAGQVIEQETPSEFLVESEAMDQGNNLDDSTRDWSFNLDKNLEKECTFGNTAVNEIPEDLNDIRFVYRTLSKMLADVREIKSDMATKGLTKDDVKWTFDDS